jgi:hypothetical protein
MSDTTQPRVEQWIQDAAIECATDAEGWVSSNLREKYTAIIARHAPKEPVMPDGEYRVRNGAFVKCYTCSQLNDNTEHSTVCKKCEEFDPKGVKPHAPKEPEGVDDSAELWQKFRSYEEGMCQRGTGLTQEQLAGASVFMHWLSGRYTITAAKEPSAARGEGEKHG